MRPSFDPDRIQPGVTLTDLEADSLRAGLIAAQKDADMTAGALAAIRQALERARRPVTRHGNLREDWTCRVCGASQQEPHAADHLCGEVEAALTRVAKPEDVLRTHEV